MSTKTTSNTALDHIGYIDFCIELEDMLNSMSITCHSEQDELEELEINTLKMSIQEDENRTGIECSVDYDMYLSDTKIRNKIMQQFSASFHSKP